MPAIADSGFANHRNLKFCSELRNLPVVSIEEGQELGVISSFLIDPEKRRIIGFILAGRDVRAGVHVVPFEAVGSFGSFALTISRASAAGELSANPYYIHLFENDIMLLGSEVRDAEGNLAGFVKDVGIDPTDGSLELLKITSDSGFLSPYHALVPFDAVTAIEKDQFFLSESHKIEFKKDSPFAEERDISYVPLVAQDQQLKQLVTDRLRSEIDRLQHEMRDRLFEHHEEYFLSRQKAVMEASLTQTMKDWLDEKMGAALVRASRDTTEYVTAAIEALFESRQLRDMYDHVGKTRDDLGRELKIEASKRSEQLRQTSEFLTGRIAEVESHIATETGALAEKLASQFKSLLIDQRMELIHRIEEAIEEKAEEAKHEWDAARAETEGRISAAGEEFERLCAEIRAGADEMRASAKDEFAAHRAEVEARVEKSISELAAVAEKIAADLDEAKSSAGESAAEMRSLLAGARVEIQSEFNGKLADLAAAQAGFVKNEMAAASEKFEGALNTRIDRLTEYFDGAVALLREELSRSAAETARKLEAVAENSAGGAAAMEARFGHIEKRLSESELFSEDIGNKFKSVAEEIGRVSSKADQAADVLGAMREEISRNAAETSQKLETIAKNAAGSAATMESRFGYIENRLLESELFNEDIGNKFKSIAGELGGISSTANQAAEAIEPLRTELAGLPGIIDNKIEEAGARLADEAAKTAKALASELIEQIGLKAGTADFDAGIAALKDSLSADMARVYKELDERIKDSAAKVSESVKKEALDGAAVIIEEKMSGAGSAAEIEAVRQQISTGLAETWREMDEKIKTAAAGIVKDAKEAASAEATKIIGKKAAEGIPAADMEALKAALSEEIIGLGERLDNDLLTLRDEYSAGFEGLKAGVDNARKAADTRIRPLEDESGAAEQALEEIRESAAGTDEKLVLIEDKFDDLRAAIEATNTLIRGTENRVAHLRDEVFSLKESFDAAPAGQRSAVLSGLDEGLGALDELRALAADIEKRISAVERAAPKSPSGVTEDDVYEAVKPVLEAQKKIEGALREADLKIASFDQILPAIADFFKDRNLKEKVNAIVLAQDESHKLLPVLEGKTALIEGALRAVEEAVKDTIERFMKMERDFDTRIEKAKSAQREPEAGVSADALNDLKIEMASAKKSALDAAAGIMEAATSEAREQAESVAAGIKQELELVIDALTRKVDRVASEQHASRPEPLVFDTKALEDLRKEIDVLRSEMELMSENANAEPENPPLTMDAALAQKLSSIEDTVGKFKEFIEGSRRIMTRDEALRLQDEVVQDAIIQIDSRFAGVAMQSDIDEVKDKLRAQFREKMDSLRDLVFDALEGKIDEIKSMFDAERYDGKGSDKEGR